MGVSYCYLLVASLRPNNHNASTALQVFAIAASQGHQKGTLGPAFATLAVLAQVLMGPLLFVAALTRDHSRRATLTSSSADVVCRASLVKMLCLCYSVSLLC